jgi:pyruvate/2-oxoglutarate dehydrogenase complex dihydrolipoamide acyltransferase (E2) component
MSTTSSVRVAPMGTRPPDVANAAVAAEEEAARANAAAAAAAAAAAEEEEEEEASPDAAATAAEEEAKADAEAATAARVAISTNAVAAEHHAMLSKMCLDPSGLVRGKYGDITLFDRRLQEDVGFMDSNPLRGIISEHLIAADSRMPFTPPNNPGLKCTPQSEF